MRRDKKVKRGEESRVETKIERRRCEERRIDGQVKRGVKDGETRTGQ